MKFLPAIALTFLCLLLALGMLRGDGEKISPLVGTKLPNAMLGGESLKARVLGQVTVLNVFASWCAPCALEHPQWMKLKEMNIARIVGVAWKNKPQDVAKWLTQHGNPYADLLLDEAGDATVPLALTGVPETFVIDGKGIIVYHSKEPVTEERLRSEIIPLVERLRQ